MLSKGWFNPRKTVVFFPKEGGGLSPHWVIGGGGYHPFVVVLSLVLSDFIR